MATLRTVLELLSTTVSAVTGDRGVENSVSEVLLVGPRDPIPEVTEAVLLCTESDEILDRISTIKASGVVVKLADDAVDQWRAAPVPVVAADHAVPWHHLLQLLNSAIRASADHPSDVIGDLFSLAGSIAAVVGGAVAIEDPQRRVLAYSSLPDQPIDKARERGILGRQVPDLPANDSKYRLIERSSGVVRIASDSEAQARLAVAVRSGSELLGSIWVIDNGSDLPDSAEQALLGASRLAALHMLHLRAANDAERRARGEVLGGLIDGRSAPDLVAGRLGLDADAPAAVLGLQLERSVINDAAQTNAVTDLVALQCCAVQPQSAVHLQLGVIYALIPAEAMPRARLRHLATTIIDRAGVALRTELTAAVGATVSSLHKIQQSRADVDVVLRLVEPGAAATVEELLPQVILLDLQAQLAAAPRRRLPIVDEMIAHDREQGTHYVDTVLAYLEFNADIASAAASLNLHHNTFRYRLHRAKELFELDLQDPDVRLVTWLQLRSRS